MSEGVRHLLRCGGAHEFRRADGEDCDAPNVVAVPGVVADRPNRGQHNKVYYGHDDVYGYLRIPRTNIEKIWHALVCVRYSGCSVQDCLRNRD